MQGAPVQATKVYEVVYRRLLDGIQSGELPVGSKLPSVRQLSIDWQVGQAAIREALSALKAMNLVTIKHGEGTFVTQQTPDGPLDFGPVMHKEEIQSLLELRAVLEAGSVRLAAQRRTDSDLVALRETLNRMQKDLTVADLGEQADWDFHYGLSRASKNPYFVTLMESLGEKIQISLRSSRLAMYQIAGEGQKLLRQHEEILDAIARGEPEDAQSALLSHLGHVEVVLKSVDEQLTN